MIRIAALGYHWSFSQFLEKIGRDRDVEVVGVLLPKNRESKLQETIAGCEALGFTWSVPAGKRELTEELRSVHRSTPIDLIVVSAYMMMIPVEVIELPQKGIINLHQALLPKHRGAHPLNWTMVCGDEYAGCTVHHMTEKVDGGNIILQRKVAIGDHDIISLSRVICDLGSDLLCEAVELFKHGIPEGTPQDERVASYDPPRTFADGEIDGSFDVYAAMRMIRALKRPWPGAFARHEGKIIVIHDGVRVSDTPRGSGIHIEEGTPILHCRNGAIRITEWEEKGG